MWQSIRNWFASFSEAESPLTDERRAWIAERFEWLHTEFGDGQLHVPIVTPSDEHFPERYDSTPEDAERILARLCVHMGIDRNRLDFYVYKSENADDVVAAFRSLRAHQGYALGAFEQTESRINIWLEGSRLHDATTVVSTLAHELGHVLLLADGRYSHDEPDHEPLTDLLTVFFGLGIFTANSTIRSVNWRYGKWEGWSVARQGYLTMSDVAYALAIYAQARGEDAPSWQRFLRADMRSLLTYELRRLEQGPRKKSEVVPDDEVQDDVASSSSVESQIDTSETPVVPDHDLLHGDDLFAQAEYQAAQGNFAEAIELYSDALRNLPEDWEAYRGRACMYLSLARYEETVADATRAIEFGDLGIEPHVFRSQALIALRKYVEALGDAERAIRIDGRYPDGFRLRGLARMGVGEHQTALWDLDRAIELHPRWAECYFIRSQLHTRLGNHRRATRDYEEAIRRDERLSDADYRSQALAWMSPIDPQRPAT